MTSTSAPGLTSDALRQAYGMFPSGVIAVCGLIDGSLAGLAASSFTSVSLHPPLVSFCIAHSSTTWPVLRRADRLGISVLAQGHERLVRQLAAKDRDRFADVDWLCRPAGAVFIRGATLWLECEIHDELSAGDHEIVVLHVVAAQPYPGTHPIVFRASQFYRLASVSSRCD